MESYANIVLQGEDFRRLVRGQSVIKDIPGTDNEQPRIEVSIVLSGIGFGVMREALRDAVRLDSLSKDEHEQS